MTLCPNSKHNLSWMSTGRVNPCNNLVGFPDYDSVEMLYNSLPYRQLVNDHATGQRSIYCTRCYDKEEIGLTSKRQTDIKLHEVYRRLDANYLKIDAAISTVCNAACRICGPNSSTLWQRLTPTWIDTSINSTVWNECNSNADRILQLDFGGGEPWVNEVNEQIALFSHIIQLNRQDRVKIRYNTNVSIWHKKLIDLIAQFREVEITLSIDDIEQRFEYNRWPLKWNQVDKNIDRFVDLAQISNIKITVNYTVSVFTWLRAAEFKIWAKQRGLDHVNFNVLNVPSVYSIHSIPEDIKKKMPTTQFDVLVASTPVTNWQKEFIAITAKLDHQRNQKFSDTFPELKNIL